MDCSMPGFPVHHQLQSLLKVMSIKSVMPYNHLILCRPSPLLPSIFPSIRVFSNESVLYIGWPKYWSYSFSINPYNKYSGLISFRMGWLDFLAVQGLSKVFSNTTVQKHQLFGAQLSSQSKSHIHTFCTLYRWTIINSFTRWKAFELFPGFGDDEESCCKYSHTVFSGIVVPSLG